MKKAININNTAKVEALLAEVQRRCRCRTITAADIQRIADKIESFYSIRPSRRAKLAGLEVIWHPFLDSFPGAYNGTPEGTEVTLVLRPSGWFLVDCRRSHCVGSYRKRVLVNIPPECKDILLDEIGQGLWYTVK